MFKVEIIGNIGADAEIKESNGSKFVTFRVADTQKWKTEGGEDREVTNWHDVILSNAESRVIPYLKAGTKVFVRGNGSLRVYSSKKDRCMKAGLTVSALEIELCGVAGDSVPRMLIIPQTGETVQVAKYYKADVDTSKWEAKDTGLLVDQRGNEFTLLKDGWVSPAPKENPNPNE